MAKIPGGRMGDEIRTRSTLKWLLSLDPRVPRPPTGRKAIIRIIPGKKRGFFTLRGLFSEVSRVDGSGERLFHPFFPDLQLNNGYLTGKPNLSERPAATGKNFRKKLKYLLRCDKNSCYNKRVVKGWGDKKSIEFKYLLFYQ